MSAALKLNLETEDLSRKPPLGENRPMPRLVWENPKLSAGTQKEKSKARLGIVSGQTLYLYVKANPLNFIDPLGLKCNSNGCWLTPLEATLANKGDYLGYYAVACANGDNYACQAGNVAANKGWQAGFTNWNLSSALEDNGWQGCEIDAVMENIRQELALAHALLLSGATENTPKVLTRNEISKFHNDIFFDYGAENDIVPVFGGDFPLSNFFFEWCAAPSCKP